MKREVGVIDEEVGSIRVLAKINRMQAFYGRGELDHPRFSEDHEYAPAVGTIVCDLEFLSQLVKRLNVRNPPGIKIHRCGAIIRFVSHLQCTLVAMNLNRIFGRADIVDVVGLGEQMDRRLTVKQEEVRADGTARYLGGILSKDGAVGSRGMTIVGRDTISKESISIGARRYRKMHKRWNRNGVVYLRKDEDACVFAGHRGVVRLLSCHGMNLIRTFLVRAYC